MRCSHSSPIAFQCISSDVEGRAELAHEIRSRLASLDECFTGLGLICAHSIVQLLETKAARAKGSKVRPNPSIERTLSAK